MSDLHSSPYSQGLMAKVAPALDAVMKEGAEEAKRWTMLRRQLGERDVSAGTGDVIRYCGSEELSVPGAPQDLSVRQTVAKVTGHVELERTWRLSAPDVRSLANDARSPHRRDLRSWIVTSIRGSNAVLYDQLRRVLEPRPSIRATGVTELVGAVAHARQILNHHALDLVVAEDTYEEVKDDKKLKDALRGGAVVPVAAPEQGYPLWLAWALRHRAGDATVLVPQRLAMHWEPDHGLGVRLILLEEFGLDASGRVPCVGIQCPQLRLRLWG